MEPFQKEGTLPKGPRQCQRDLVERGTGEHLRARELPIPKQEEPTIRFKVSKRASRQKTENKGDPGTACQQAEKSDHDWKNL